MLFFNENFWIFLDLMYRQTSLDLSVPLLSGSQGTQSIGLSSAIGHLKDFSERDYVLSGHTSTIWTIRISPDSRYIYSGSADCSIVVWDSSLLCSAAVLSGHTDTVLCIELLSIVHQLISSGADLTIRVWDLSTYTQVSIIEGLPFTIYSLVLISNDSKIAACGENASILLWDLLNKSQLAELNGHSDWINALVKTNTEKFLISGSKDKTLITWDLETNSVSSTMELTYIVQCLRLVENDKFLLVGTRSNCIYMMSFPEKIVLSEFIGHTMWVRQVLVTNDFQYLVSCANDKTIRIWSIKDPTDVVTLNNSEGAIYALAMGKNEKFLASGGVDSEVKLTSLPECTPIETFAGHTGGVKNIVVCEAQRLLITSSSDKTIRVWDLDTKIEKFKLTGHTAVVWALGATSDLKYIVSGSSDKTIRVWDFESKSEIYKFDDHTGEILDLVISKNDEYAVSGSNDKSLIVWSLKQPGLVKKLLGHKGAVLKLAMNYSDNTVISCSFDTSIRVWSLINLEFIFKFEPKYDVINCIDLSKDGSFLGIGCKSQVVHIWDYASKKCISSHKHHTAAVKCVTFASPDKKILASTSDDCKIVLWNFLEKQLETVLTYHTGLVKKGLFSQNDCSFFSVSDDKTIKKWTFSKSAKFENILTNTTPVESYLYLRKIFSAESLPTKWVKFLVGPLKINASLMYSFTGQDFCLKQVLENGGEICQDMLGKSCLYYCMKKNMQNCVDVILRYLIEISENDLLKFENYCFVIRNDLSELMQNNSPCIEEFLQAIFAKKIKKESIKIGVPRADLPILVHSDDNVIDFSKFLAEVSQNNTEKEIMLVFRSCTIALPTELGSLKSIELLSGIKNYSNKQVLSNFLIRTLIRSKWNAFRPFIIFQTAILWISLLAVGLVITESEKSVFAITLFVTVNFLLLMYEIIEIAAGGIKEYLEFWNLIDFSKNLVSFIWLFLSYQAPSRLFDIVTWVMVLLSFLRGLTGFRAFDETRNYLRLIFKSTKESLSFLLIFFYSTLAFGFLNYSSIIDPSEAGAFQIVWLSPFELSMGSGNLENDSAIYYLYFMLASTLNVIIMLNLLISILGDSFERFQLEVLELDNLEMLKIILEIELMMFWKRAQNVYQHLQLCEAYFTNVEDDWQGKVKAIEKSLEKYANETKDSFKQISEDAKGSSHAISQSHEKLEGKISDIAKKVDTIDSRMQKLEETVEKTLGNIEKSLEVLLSKSA